MVASEARLVAAAICCVITVVDPSLIVLGGGIGQAPGFAEAVTAALAEIAPVLPEVKVSAHGTDVVVDGCLAEATAMAWTQLIASLPWKGSPACLGACASCRWLVPPPLCQPGTNANVCI